VLYAPQFQYSVTEPSCFGFSDGQIDFGSTPPYEFSIDNGQHFSTEKSFEGLRAGKYTLVAEDESGCYNQPIRLQMDQPDSIYVNLVATQLPTPLRPGDEVILEGFPSHPVSATVWNPAGTNNCPDCLRDTFYPETRAWVTLTTFDPDGCSAFDSLLLYVEPPVYAPNVIRPGSMTGNDRFVLSSEYPLPIRRLSIFDRWGNQVFEKQHLFTNDSANGWDGNFRGKLVSPGIFVFVAEVEVVPGHWIKLSGDVLVVK
jgi:hypothetical protein